MTETHNPARQATGGRFIDVVMGGDRSYPDGASFVAGDLPDLATVLARNLSENRTTVVVHDDRSELVIEPPELGRFALFVQVAQLRYDASAGTWSLYCRDRDERWWRYDDVVPSPTVDPLLAEIAADPTGSFWG